MASEIVLTLTGADRVGIVENVTGKLLELGGNIGPSRMTRLGGEFSMLVLVTLPDDSTAALETAFGDLAAHGYKVTVTPTHSPAPEAREGWAPYHIELSGADHEGIVHDIAAQLAALGITIESAETDIVEAPITGSPLFTMNAEVLVPKTLVEAEWTDAIVDAARRANVDVEVNAQG